MKMNFEIPSQIDSILDFCKARGSDRTELTVLNMSLSDKSVNEYFNDMNWENKLSFSLILTFPIESDKCICPVSDVMLSFKVRVNFVNADNKIKFMLQNKEMYADELTYMLLNF